jgi:hypothetical protein
MTSEDENKKTLREEEAEVEEGESELIHDLGKGVVAGLAAVIPVAVLILIQGAVGLLPQVNFISLLTNLTGVGWGGAGWIFLFVAGGLLGVGFAALDSHVEHVTGAGEIAHGVLFAVLLWAALMLTILPVYGGDVFGLGFAIAVLAGVLVYGVVMGAIYAAMKPEEVPQ